jgi:hypothetical protein
VVIRVDVCSLMPALIQQESRAAEVPQVDRAA